MRRGIGLPELVRKVDFHRAQPIAEYTGKLAPELMLMTRKPKSSSATAAVSPEACLGYGDHA